jgi:hypothetical protein
MLLYISYVNQYMSVFVNPKKKFKKARGLGR